MGAKVVQTRAEPNLVWAMPSVADIRKFFAKVQRFFDMAMVLGKMFHAEYAEYAERYSPERTA